MAGQAISVSSDTESFERLYAAFVSSREGLQPQVIFTDRALAAKVAIRTTLPGCRHLICEFHLMQNVRENLSKLGDAYGVSARRSQH